MPPVKKQKTSGNRSVKQISADKPAAAEVEETQVVSGQLKKKLAKQHKKTVDPRGVVFIKHLPHGFFEEQLKKYFEQFGNVTRLRLARSKRTGGSKNFAFVEFEYPEVAQVAAETMQNYLMFKKVVKAAYIPPEQQRFNYFKSTVRKVRNKAGKEIYVSAKSSAIQRKVNRVNDWSDNAYQKRTKAQLKKIEQLKKKFGHLGVDFSQFVVEPKKLTAEEKAAWDAQNAAAAEIAIEQPAPSAGKAKRKQTTPTQPIEGKAAAKKPKTKKEIELVDLLGNTINEDSDDEDYIAIATEKGDEQASDDDSSDEETYGFTKDSDNDDSDNADDASSNDDEEVDDDHTITGARTGPKKPKSFGKPVKSSKVDRFEQLIKRKPLLGGIQKNSKKPLKKPSSAKPKSAQQLQAAQELTKEIVAGKKGKANTQKPLTKAAKAASAAKAKKTKKQKS